MLLKSTHIHRERNTESGDIDKEKKNRWGEERKEIKRQIDRWLIGR